MDRGTLNGDVEYALSSKKGELVVAATFAASELQSPQLSSPLIALMRSPDARIRNRAVYALGKIGDHSSSRALVAQIPQVRESRMLNNIAFALERLDPTAFYQTAQGLVTHSQAQIRMNAAYVVGDVRRPEGLPLLRTALDDKNDSVRLSAITAIGKLDAPDGAKLLDKYVDDPNASLRSAAVYAIYALSGMKRTDLVYDKYYASPRPAEKLSAVRALGRGRDPRVTGDLLACIDLDRGCELNDYDATLRLGRSPEVPGRLLLAWAHGHEELTDLVAFLHPEGARTMALAQMGAGLARKDVEMATNAIDLSGIMTDAQAVDVLKPLLTHENARLRLHAAVALARDGHEGALPVLVQELQNLPHEQLPAAVRLLSTVVQPDVIQRITPSLQTLASGADAPLAVAARAALVEWSPETAIFALLQTLRGPTRQERDLAELYLVQSQKPAVTELLRRALAREGDVFVRNQIRRILDRRNERETRFVPPG
jgi:HEAT repeat protein